MVQVDFDVFMMADGEGQPIDAEMATAIEYLTLCGNSGEGKVMIWIPHKPIDAHQKGTKCLGNGYVIEKGKMEHFISHRPDIVLYPGLGDIQNTYLAMVYDIGNGSTKPLSECHAKAAGIWSNEMEDKGTGVRKGFGEEMRAFVAVFRISWFSNGCKGRWLRRRNGKC